MQLSDTDIQQSLQSWAITVSLLNEKDIQPASVDIHLWNTFLRYKESLEAIDTRKPQEEQTIKTTIEYWESIIIQPQEFMLACTLENIWVNNQYAAQITWKSSLWRLGITVHTTAGFIDPWNTLVVTLELVNHNNRPIILYAWDYIWQVIFTKLLTPCKDWYWHKDRNSKYLNSTTTEASKNYKNF